MALSGRRPLKPSFWVEAHSRVLVMLFSVPQDEQVVPVWGGYRTQQSGDSIHPILDQIMTVTQQECFARSSAVEIAFRTTHNQNQIMDVSLRRVYGFVRELRPQASPGPVGIEFEFQPPMTPGTEGLSEMLPPTLSRYQVGRLVQHWACWQQLQLIAMYHSVEEYYLGRLEEANRSYDALTDRFWRLHDRHAQLVPGAAEPLPDDVPFLTNGHLHPYSDSGSNSEEF